MTRRLLAVAACVFLSASVGVGTGPDATAATGFPFQIKATCDGDLPSTLVLISENFTGLASSPPYSYAVVAYHDLGDPAKAVTIAESPWYPDNGGHSVTDQAEFAYGPGALPGVRAGDTFTWELHKTYGTDQIAASGTATASGTACKHKPLKAQLGSSPSAIQVKASGAFSFPFKAGAGSKGVVKFTHDGSVIASAGYTSPASGKPVVHLKLSAKRLKALKKAGSWQTTAKVTISNVSGAKPATKSVKLKAPH